MNWLNLNYESIDRPREETDITQARMWEILAEVKRQVPDPEQRIICLSLYGSQNYKLNSETSDIDTECFIFPTVEDFIFNKNMFSTCVNTEYGTCHIKDVRAAFNELRKSSPNMLELFASPYMIINKEYAHIWNTICFNVDYNWQRQLFGRYIKLTF